MTPIEQILNSGKKSREHLVVLRDISIQDIEEKDLSLKKYKDLLKRAIDSSEKLNKNAQQDKQFVNDLVETQEKSKIIQSQCIKEIEEKELFAKEKLNILTKQNEKMINSLDQVIELVSKNKNNTSEDKFQEISFLFPFDSIVSFHSVAKNFISATSDKKLDDFNKLFDSISEQMESSVKELNAISPKAKLSI